MEKQSSRSIKLYQSVIFALTWFALIGQFYITATTKVTSFAEMLARYFGFFTIQTNILVAVCFTVLLFRPNSKWGNFFSKQQTLAAITVYIVIVGIIYNSILRFLWAPTGLQKIVDELLHTANPALVLIYWLIFVSKNQLEWKNVLPWLIYPLLYIVYILIRGSVTGYYPYPFIDSKQLGLNKVLVNSVGIAIVFTVVSLILVGVGKFLNKKI